MAILSCCHLTILCDITSQYTDNIGVANSILSTIALNAILHVPVTHAAALWNLTYDEATRAAVAAAGGIIPLVALLQSHSLEVQQHAAGALTNLAVDSHMAVTIADQAGTALLVQLLGSSSVQIVGFAADIVQDCLLKEAAAAGDSAAAGFSQALAVDGGLAALVRLLSVEADAAQADMLAIRQSAAACLTGLATDPVHAKTVAELDGGVLALVRLTKSSSWQEQAMSATILGLIAAVDDDCRRAISQAGGAAALVMLLSSSSHAAVADAAAAISNLASEANCRKALTEAGGIQKLLSLLSQAQLQQQPGGTTSCAPDAAVPAATMADRPSLSLMSGALSGADSLVSQPDSWLCPMSSVAPLVDNAAVAVDS